jgi:adenylate cyclase
MHCVNCSFDNPDGMNFCGKCGTSLQPCCAQCGFENLANFAFCGKCGTALVSRSKPVLSPVEGFQVPSQESELRTANSERPPIAYTPAHLAERIRAEQAALEARGATDGERKTITMWQSQPIKL